MKNSENTLILGDSTETSVEIEILKKQLVYEKQQRKHWQELAMIFHDALWSELKRANNTSGK